jgi:hypothetical protein
MTKLNDNYKTRINPDYVTLFQPESRFNGGTGSVATIILVVDGCKFELSYGSMESRDHDLTILDELCGPKFNLEVAKNVDSKV